MTAAWWILGAAAFLAAAALLTAYICFYRVFYSSRREKEEQYPIPEGEVYEPYRDVMVEYIKKADATPYREVSIKSFDGLTLRGRYYEFSKGAPIELMLHGYRGSGRRDLSGGMERCFLMGHNALIIDHRASGESDGHVITFGILEKRDALAWVDFAVKEFGEDAKLILTGISMGAATVMMAAGEELPPQIQYVLADCGYTSPQEIISKVMRDLKLPPALLYPCATLGARLFGGFDLNGDSPLEAMARCKVPVVFAHGDADDFVPYDMSVRLCEVCTGRHKKLVTIKDAGHGLAFPVGRDEYVNALAEFKRECGFDF